VKSLRFRRRLRPAVLFLAVAAAGLAILEPLRAQDRPTDRPADRPTVRVLAAGSLRNAIGEIGAAFLSATTIAVESSFGPSGVLRERIEKGETPDLFASADMGNPLALAKAGKSGPVVLFARNRLCAFLRPGLKIDSSMLLTAMLDPKMKLGTSTPKADPAGDYTWDMFAKADAIHPGNAALLQAKALQLVGGPASAAPPAGMDVAAWHIREGRADIFISYCSSAAAFNKGVPDATIIGLPDRLATAAAYGLTLLPTQNANAGELALFILSGDGQKILAKNGFTAPLLEPVQ
jgi:molybdate transport system substrate-binding protein